MKDDAAKTDSANEGKTLKTHFKRFGITGGFSRKKSALLAGAVLLVLVTTMIINHNSVQALTMKIDGRTAVCVTSEEEAAKILEQVRLDLSAQSQIAVSGFANEIVYEPADKKQAPVSSEELYSLVKDSLDWQTDGWVIRISGKPDLCLPSEMAANEALTRIKEYYLPPQDGAAEIEEVVFAEQVDVVMEKVSTGAICTTDEAFEILARGQDKLVQHEVVGGDTLWMIAHDNKMTVDELKEMNPQLTSDFLRLGQTLNLVKIEPLLTVVAKVKTTVTEKIPYKTTYIADGSMWRGQQKVKSPGTSGVREVTYRIVKNNDLETSREVLNEIIKQEPVTQVVIQGTKTIIASRGDGGSGALGWPMRGRITCPFGKNRGAWGIHSGMDIDGVVGDPIYSAGDGTVISVAYQGNYGKCVQIDHGDGLLTLYAHLDQYHVSMGQTVSRGDVVGTVGLTGRTTGSHLHFEVQINGVAKNPINYLD